HTRRDPCLEPSHTKGASVEVPEANDPVGDRAGIVENPGDGPSQFHRTEELSPLQVNADKVGRPRQGPILSTIDSTDRTSTIRDLAFIAEINRAVVLQGACWEFTPWRDLRIDRPGLERPVRGFEHEVPMDPIPAV